MPTIGNIVEDGKLLVPVYVEGEGSSSSGEGSTTIIPTSTLGLTGGFYSGTFYGMALGSDGRLTTFSWNRSGDPVVISNGLSLPISGNPTATGYMVYNEIIDSSTPDYYNLIHITQQNESITSGNFKEILSLAYKRSNVTRFAVMIKNETSKNLIISAQLDGNLESSSSTYSTITGPFNVTTTLNSNESSNILYPGNYDDTVSSQSYSSFSCTFTFQVLN